MSVLRIGILSFPDCRNWFTERDGGTFLYLQNFVLRVLVKKCTRVFIYLIVVFPCVFFEVNHEETLLCELYITRRLTYSKSYWYTGFSFECELTAKASQFFGDSIFTP